MNLILGEEIMDEIGVADLVMASGHAYCNKEGKFEMDSFLLLQFLCSYPDIDNFFASILHNRRKHRKEYNFISSNEIVNYLKSEGVILGLFQNRIKPQDVPSLDIIGRSVRRLNFWAENFERIAIEYPDPTGKLKRDDVLEAIKPLQKNIWVYASDVVVAEGDADGHSLPRGLPADHHRR